MKVAREVQPGYAQRQDWGCPPALESGLDDGESAVGMKDGGSVTGTPYAWRDVLELVELDRNDGRRLDGSPEFWW